MDFTREPIIETVITPKEGCKIVVRSSKNVAQEEYFVDALEVVSFGSALFFRSLEKPKAFLVPASDYEILEVREARMVLKNVGLDRSIKIGGGRESKAVKEPAIEKADTLESEPSSVEEQAASDRTEKKRDRRRQQRRRRGREETVKEEAPALASDQEGGSTEVTQSNGEGKLAEGGPQVVSTTTFMSALLPPPPTLISETISRYKENGLFKNAFYSKEEVEAAKEESESSEPEIAKDEVEEKVNEALQPSFEAETNPSPFATFWDDMTEPSLPPMPYIEKTEGEETSSEPFAPEENKE